MEKIISEYEQQALDFLAKTKTALSIVFKAFGPMSFDKDATKRNIFTVNLKNDKHSYSFDFGDSLANSCKPTSVIESDGPCNIYTGFMHGGDIGIRFSYEIKTTYETLRNNTDRLALIDRTALNLKIKEYRDEIAKYNKKKHKFEAGILGASDEKILKKVEDSIYAMIQNAHKEKTALVHQADEIKTPDAYSILCCLTKYEVGSFENFCSEFGYDEDSRFAERTYHAVKEDWENVSKLFTEEELTLLQEIN